MKPIHTLPVVLQGIKFSSRVRLNILACVMLFVQSSSAHVILTSHGPRHDSTQIKSGPCGIPTSARGTTVHRFEPGEVVHLVWNEYISHPGYFRISFDRAGHDDFVDPVGYYDFYTNATVLADNLFPHERHVGGASYEYDLTLPDVECEECTLQLIQMMTDKPPFVSGTNDIYYNCLDIALERASLDGDLNRDQAVDSADAAILFANWGPIPPSDPVADVNQDQIVDAVDAGTVFGNWTGDRLSGVPEPSVSLPALVVFCLTVWYRTHGRFGPIHAR